MKCTTANTGAIGYTARMSAPAPRWPEVTSKLARRALSWLADNSPACSDPAAYAGYRSTLHGTELQYRDWLTTQLARSTLAQQLVAGPPELPDITGFFPWPLSLWLQMTRPKSLSGQVEWLMRYLDLYVDPGHPARLKFDIQWGWGLLWLAVLALTALLVRNSYSLIPFLVFFAAILLSGTLQVQRRHVGTDPIVRRLINSSELFWYLHDVFSEPAAVSPVCDSLPAADAIAAPAAPPRPPPMAERGKRA